MGNTPSAALARMEDEGEGRWVLGNENDDNNNDNNNSSKNITYKYLM